MRPMLALLRGAIAVLLMLTPAYAASASISDGVVRVGIILDMAGPYAPAAGPGSLAAVHMAVEDFGGKVLGVPIEVVSADHQNKPDVALLLARRWFDTQQLDAILDTTNSAAAIAVMGLGGTADKVVIINGPGAVRMSNEDCTTTSVHYTWDTYAIATSGVRAIAQQGRKKWFFIITDSAFGHDLERDALAALKELGGTSVGRVRFPIGTMDFSSFLLQAQASGADVIAFGSGGKDTVNLLKGAGEFGMLDNSKQYIVSLLNLINDVHDVGLQSTRGMYLTEGFYWDMNDETRAFSQRFMAKAGHMPNMVHAGTYSATMTYLKAVEAAGTDNTAAVMRVLRERPINDVFAKNGRIRADGRMVHDMYLFQSKSPAESKRPWDYYKHVATIPGDEAFQPISTSRCPLVKK